MSFRVPEHLRWQHPDRRYRSAAGDPFGHFLLRTGDRILLCIACDGVDDGTIGPDAAGWEHVSVSVQRRGGATRPALPTWEEMCNVKALFWGPEDVVVQYHPAESQYVNHAPVLHLWRRDGFPTPHPGLVGPRAAP